MQMLKKLFECKKKTCDKGMKELDIQGIELAALCEPVL
jgi:hypothetical protein